MEDKRMDSVADVGKDTLITHLTVKEEVRLTDKPSGTDKTFDTAYDILENKSKEDLETVEEILIEDLIFRKVTSNNPNVLNDTTEIENVTLDNILDNIKGLEDENFLLRAKLKLEQDRFEMENKEKQLLQHKMEEQKKLIENIKIHTCCKGEEETSNVERENVDVKFHGFDDAELVKTLKLKTDIDNTVSRANTASKDLESVLKQTKRRNLLEMLICLEEANFNKT